MLLQNSIFPSNNEQFQCYAVCTNHWELDCDPIDAKTLKIRKQTTTNKHKEATSAQGKCLSAQKKEHSRVGQQWGCGLLNGCQHLHRSQYIESLLRSLNIDMGKTKSNRVSSKMLKCWKLSASTILLCINSSLCPIGVQIQKLDTLTFYDKPLPVINFMLNAKVSLRFTKEEKKGLTFGIYSLWCQLSFLSKGVMKQGKKLHY